MTETQPMGIGVLGDDKCVFARKYRWTFGSPGLPCNFMHDVSFDFVKKRIEMHVLEVVPPDSDKIPVHAWVDQVEKEDLVFTAYDGCGRPIYRYTYSDILIIEDTSEFDYASSDVSTRRVVVSYGKQTYKSLFERVKVEHATHTLNS